MFSLVSSQKGYCVSSFLSEGENVFVVHNILMTPCYKEPCLCGESRGELCNYWS